MHRRHLAYLAVAGSVGYGALKLAWSFGSTVGIQGTPPWVTRTGWWEHASGLVRFFAFEGTVILSVLAAALALALAQAWGRRLPQWPLIALAWTGAGLVGTTWVGGTVLMFLRVMNGDSAHPTGQGETTGWAYWLVSSSFAALAVGLAAAGLEGKRRLDVSRRIQARVVSG